MNKKEEKIIQTIESLADDIIDFTCRLVKEPSTLGNEASVVDLMKNELEKLSFSPVLIPIDQSLLSEHPGFAGVPWTYENKNNVVAVRPPCGNGGRSVIFNGHLDVVDPEPVSFWDSDPFEPVIKNGRIFGTQSQPFQRHEPRRSWRPHPISCPRHLFQRFVRF